MIDLLTRTASLAAMAGAVLLLAGCGGDSDGAANDSGANAGSTTILISRITCVNTAPSSFSPSAEPTRWMGIVISIFSPLAILRRSAWIRRPVIGSI